MVTIGCAGFPVPATRYFKEFAFVEIQETFIAVPGTGSLRRWKREAPAGFTFALLGPRDIGQEAFRQGSVTESALRNLEAVSKELSAKYAVFTSPPELVSNRANKAAVKDFLALVRPQFETVVWEAAHWDADDVVSLATAAGVVPAVDPLRAGTTKAKFGYYRLGGPAGHKSRYEDHAMERLAEVVAASKHEDAIYVFTNVDMFQDAKRLKKALKLE
jgi:uncharacterized protein YecE (DUF72 family)